MTKTLLTLIAAMSLVVLTSDDALAQKPLEGHVLPADARCMDVNLAPALRNARHRDAGSRQDGRGHTRHGHTEPGWPQRQGQHGLERPERSQRRIGRRRQRGARPRHGGSAGRRGPVRGAGVGGDDGKR